MHHTLSHLAIQGSVPWQGGSQPSYEDVIALISRHTNVPVLQLVHRSRRHKPAARARQLAMYLCHVVQGRSLTQIGKAFGRDRTTVSHACALIEDLRDDARFDAEVTALEQQLQEGADHAA